MTTKKHKNKVFNIIKLILIIFIIAIIVYKVIKLILVPTDISVVENGLISSEETAIGYVIRDEKIAKGNNYQNGMYQIKTEGEKVANGDPIFRY